VRRGLCRPELARRIAQDVLPRTAAFEVGFDPGFAARVVRRLTAAPQARTAQPSLQPLPYEQLFEAEQHFAKARKLARETADKIPGLSDFLKSPDD
jgi:hypothetical protein